MTALAITPYERERSPATERRLAVVDQQKRLFNQNARGWVRLLRDSLHHLKAEAGVDGLTAVQAAADEAITALADFEHDWIDPIASALETEAEWAEQEGANER